MSAERIRLVLADDQKLVRDGMAAILSHGEEFAVVACCADGVEAVEATREHRPDVVLMDIGMPRMDGLEATRRIIAELPSTRVIIVTTFDEDEHLFTAVRNGASGFLLKGVGSELLKEAIRTAVHGEAIISPSLTVRLFEQMRRGRRSTSTPSNAAGTLTPRESEVTWHVARGLSNAEVARALHLSLSTVKSHLTSIQGKLGARNRVEIAAWAWSSGLMAQSSPPRG